jgi:hypothetical protein
MEDLVPSRHGRGVAVRIITLHLQHYLGIKLFPEDKKGNDSIREVGMYLEGITMTILQDLKYGRFALRIGLIEIIK